MIELHCGDSLEYLKTLPDGCVDAIITDLPYGTTQAAFDVLIPFAPMWNAVKRVLKPKGAFVTTASQPFTSKLVMSNLGWFKYCLVWEKQQPTGFLDAKRKPMKSHEDVVVFCNGQSTYNPQGTLPVEVNNGRKNKAGNGVYGAVAKGEYIQAIGNYPRSVLHFDRVTHSQMHPTQKPVALYEYLIRTYTHEGDTVLDFTMGSGTTGVACVQTGRNFIGCELDAGYFSIAQSRIESACVQMQPTLLAAD